MTDHEMTDEEMAAYLRENGYPEHIVRAGRAGLIERWRKFVEEVERGYKLGLEDYRNDLDLRGIIAMLGLDRRGRRPRPALRKHADRPRTNGSGRVVSCRPVLGLRLSGECRAENSWKILTMKDLVLSTSLSQ